MKYYVMHEMMRSCWSILGSIAAILFSLLSVHSVKASTFRRRRLSACLHTSFEFLRCLGQTWDASKGQLKSIRQGRLGQAEQSKTQRYSTSKLINLTSIPHSMRKLSVPSLSLRQSRSRCDGPAQNTEGWPIYPCRFRKTTRRPEVRRSRNLPTYKYDTRPTPTALWIN